MAPPAAESTRQQHPSRTPVEDARTPDGIHLRNVDGQEPSVRADSVLVGLRLARRGEERWRTGGPGDRQAVGRRRCRSIRPMTAASSRARPGGGRQPVADCTRHAESQVSVGRWALGLRCRDLHADRLPRSGNPAAGRGGGSLRVRQWRPRHRVRHRRRERRRLLPPEQRLAGEADVSGDLPKQRGGDVPARVEPASPESRP